MRRDDGHEVIFLAGNYDLPGQVGSRPRQQLERGSAQEQTADKGASSLDRSPPRSQSYCKEKLVAQMTSKRRHRHFLRPTVPKRGHASPSHFLPFHHNLFSISYDKPEKRHKDRAGWFMVRRDGHLRLRLVRRSNTWANLPPQDRFRRRSRVLKRNP